MLQRAQIFTMKKHARKSKYSTKLSRPFYRENIEAHDEAISLIYYQEKANKIMTPVSENRSHANYWKSQI